MSYALDLSDGGGGSETVECPTLPDHDRIAEVCRDWVENGEWGDGGAELTVYWVLHDPDDEEIDSGSVDHSIPPDHRALIRAAVPHHDRASSCGDDPEDHDWSGEDEGGCDENPGVWSIGGTAIQITEHCERCGLRRTQVDMGAQRNPGEGDTVEYSWDCDE
jgi:hypothetical protein